MIARLIFNFFPAVVDNKFLLLFYLGDEGYFLPDSDKALFAGTRCFLNSTNKALQILSFNLFSRNVNLLGSVLYKLLYVLFHANMVKS